MTAGVTMGRFFAGTAPSGFICCSWVPTHNQTVSWLQSLLLPLCRSSECWGALQIEHSQHAWKDSSVSFCPSQSWGGGEVGKNPSSLQLCLGMASWNGFVFSPWPPPKETDHLWVSVWFSRKDKHKHIEEGNSDVQGDNKCQAILACTCEMILNLLFVILPLLQRCLHLSWVWPVLDI